MSIVDSTMMTMVAAIISGLVAWTSIQYGYAWRACAVMAAFLLTSPWPALCLAPIVGVASARLRRGNGARDQLTKSTTTAKSNSQGKERPAEASQGIPRSLPGATAANLWPARPLAEVLADFDGLVGLSAVRLQIETIAARIQLDRERREAGLPSREPLGLAFVMQGNPGTGKTTSARLLAEVLHCLGALPTPKILECSREDLVGQYIGHTEAKVAEMIQKAAGGLLFIDEAHTLIGDGKYGDFGDVAVKVLLRAIENERGKFGVIVAGYPVEMERFLASDPGFRQRFGTFIDFPDYTATDLSEIFRKLAIAEGFVLTRSADSFLQAFCIELIGHRERDFANARLMRKLLEISRNLHALRLIRGNVARTSEAIQTIEKTDLLGAAQELRSSLIKPQ
jgi:hypothetical protein